MRKPNFLVIGAQKAGTTFLCSALARHPNVFVSDPKEPLYFQRGDVNEETFAQYLQEHFADAGKQKWVGEGSAVYLQWRESALNNVRRFLGDELRLFACLRHPTDRAVSFYLHNLRKGRLKGTEPLDCFRNDVRLSPVLSSLYAPHLRRWMASYGDKLKVLLFDDLLESPEGFVRAATDHLGIAPMKVLKEGAVNRGFTLGWDGEALSVEGKLPEGVTRPRFTRAELEDLHARFLDDIDKTSALIGRPLEHWKSLPEFTAKQANF